MNRGGLHFLRVHHHRPLASERDRDRNSGIDDGGGLPLLEDAIRICDDVAAVCNSQDGDAGGGMPSPNKNQAEVLRDLLQRMKAQMRQGQSVSGAAVVAKGEPGEEGASRQGQSVLDFQSEHRGVLLICGHSLQSMLDGHGAHGRRGGRCHNGRKTGQARRKTQDRLRALVCLVQMAVELVDHRHSDNASECNDSSITTGNDASTSRLSQSVPIPFASMESKGVSYVNPMPREVQQEFLQDIATKATYYTHSTRQFLDMMVRITACHSRMTRWVTDRSTQLLHKLSHADSTRQTLFCSMLPSYMLHSHSSTLSSAECVKFFNLDITQESGKQLWEMLDTGIFNLYHRSILEHVNQSRVFTISIRDALEGLGASPMQAAERDPPSEHRDGSVSMTQFQRSYGAVFRYIRCKLNEQGEEIMVRMRLISPFQELHRSDTRRKNNNVDGNCSNASVSFKNDAPIFSWMSGTRKWMRDMLLGCAGGKGHHTTGTHMSDCLIFHMHGGGFISMSSNSHESYLRVWAKECAVPIVSVDYEKAPQRRFPHQVAECFAAYRWCLQNYAHLHRQAVGDAQPIPQEPRKIIIAGDSAGGNLAMAVTLMAINTPGMREPDAAVLCYPSTFRTHVMSPSRLLSLFDPMVNIGFHRVVDDCYFSALQDTQDADPSMDALLSPGIAPDELLRQFPSTYLTVSSADPLLDETVYAAKRIARSNRERVALEVYDGLFHGYISVQHSVADGKKANDNVMHWIKTTLAS